jgi:peroxiredoxin
MKKLFVIILFIPYVSFSQTLKTAQPIEKPDQILKSLNSFLDYVGRDVHFYEDYFAYDTLANRINKETYLKALVTGQYLPLRLASDKAVASYQLYKLRSANEKSYGSYIKGWSQIAYDYYKREGKKLPVYSFTDLKGNIYNQQTTKGKILVLKCWFIACSTCEKQRPAYNELVKQYKAHKDIVFTSLADEPEKPVQSFLKTKRMDYMVVPGQLDYIRDKLNINGYPVYFIIDRNGVIAKVVETPDDVNYVLKKML